MFAYRISANSFRGNYSFLNLALCTVTFALYLINLNSCRGNYSKEETIQGRKLFAEIRYANMYLYYAYQTRLVSWFTYILHLINRLLMFSHAWWSIKIRVPILKKIAKSCPRSCWMPPYQRYNYFWNVSPPLQWQLSKITSLEIIPFFPAYGKLFKLLSLNSNLLIFLSLHWTESGTDFIWHFTSFEVSFRFKFSKSSLFFDVTFLSSSFLK